DGALRASLRRVRVHARRDARRVRRPRARVDPYRGRAPRLDGLGRACGDRRVRERARVPRPDVGAAAHERDPHRARLHARARVGRALRVHARRRPPRPARLGRLRRDHGRDRARRARRGSDARAAPPPPEARVTVVLLALSSAATFGAMTIAIRFGLRGGNAATAALSMLLWATAVSVVAALPRHDLHRTWEFLLAGLLAPGCSQVLFTLSVREAGPSQTSIAVG